MASESGLSHRIRNGYAPIPRQFLIGVLAIGAFATSLNTTILSPLLKLVAADYGVSAAIAGQLATLTEVCAGLTALLSAPWLDRYSRRACLRFEAVILGAGTLLSVFAPSFTWLFIGRALAGVGGAFIFAICLAAVGDLFPDTSERNRVIGVVGSAATLGAVVGLPIVSQLGALRGWRWAMASIIPLLIVLFVGASWLPLPAPNRQRSPWRDWTAGYRQVLAMRETFSLLGMIVALSMIWFGWLLYFGAYADTVFDVSTGILGLLFFFGGGAEVVANNLTPIILRHRPPRAVILWTTAILGANFSSVGIIYVRVWGLFLFVAVASFSCVVLFMCTSILLLDSVPKARGTVMALQSAAFSLGGALGAAGAGAALAALDNYEGVYRLLGIVLPVTIIPLALRGCRPTRPAFVDLTPADPACRD